MSAAVKQARSYLDRGQNRKALGVLQEALSADPSNVSNWIAAGAVLLAIGENSDAEQAFLMALQLDPGSWKAHLHLGHAYMEMGVREKHIQSYRKAVAHAPEQPETLTALGFSLAHMGHWEEATQLFVRAYKAGPTNPKAAAGIAEVLVQRKDLDDAWVVIEPHVTGRKPNAQATLTAANIAKLRKRPDDVIPSIRRVLSDPGDSMTLVSLSYCLGDLLDQQGDTDGAFDAFKLANTRRKLQFDIRQHEHAIHGLTQLFDAERFARPSSGITSERPVLIVGAPRSGTSLTEQVLASHPGVTGAGELETLRDVAVHAARTLQIQNYLRDLDAVEPLSATLGQMYLNTLAAIDPDAARVTDKMPHNFMHLGLAARILPGARVIHVTRDPIDTCWSCYRQNFSAGLSYTTNLTVLGRWYVTYRKLMAHWEQVLPLPIHTVRYEDLVQDPEPTIRGLVDFVGLPWDDACLSPHKNDRVVATASRNQVQQPIHKKWIGRSASYREHLEPLVQALGPWAP